MTVIAGRYRLLDVLAEGSAGTVWRALDETSGQDVALKEFRAPAGLPADKVPLLYARREREARAAARIAHPAVVRVLGVVTEDGRPWVVTELVRGLTLAETLEAAGPLPVREAARTGAEVLSALRAAREAGAPHRGVRARHVLLANDGRIAVTGFGATPGDAPEPEAELRSLGELLDGAVSALPSADDRTVALRAVVEGLTHPDRARPLTADRAEEELRRVAGGGARPPRTESGAPVGGAPTGGEPGGPEAVDAPNGPPAAPRSVAQPQRRRSPRRSHVLLAGLVGALLIAAALAYQAVREKDRGAGPGPVGVTSTAPAGPGALGAGGGGGYTTFLNEGR
ncbi:protein kinase [Streptomyces sp. NPDC058326]|uniref:protein kinase domain-containing protein n=1 Tax=Streptomyces sp. NPDC058326 TaxID=3346447 RepID=UPI0036E79F0E